MQDEDWKQRIYAEIQKLQEYNKKLIEENHNECMRMVNKIGRDLQNYIKKDADAIEEEASFAVQKYLVGTHMDKMLYIPQSYMDVLRDPHTNEKITDLDGVFLLTSNPAVRKHGISVILRSERGPDFLSPGEKERAMALKEMRQLSTEDKHTIQMVIIETKHEVTDVDIIDKFGQIEKIKEYIRIAKEYKTYKDNESTFPEGYKMPCRKFICNIQQYTIWNYHEDVMLFIGGPRWTKAAYKELERLLQEKPEYRQLVGIVQPNGDRFGIASSTTGFVLKGGRLIPKKTRSIKTT